MHHGFIYGAGAIGSLLGGFLSQKKGKEFTLIAKRNHALKIEKKGLSIMGLVDGIFYPQVIERLTSIPEKSIVLITTKATDLGEILHQLSPLVKPDTVVVTLQNGLGVSEMAKAALKDRCKVLRGLVFIAASYYEPGKIYYEGGNTIKLERGPGDAEVVNSFQGTPLVVEKVDDIEVEVLIKSMINAIINPLTALESITVGELNQLKYREMIKGLIKEFVQIAEAQAIPLEEKQLWKILERTIAMIPTTKTSMSQDLALGRLTEIDFINGALIKLGNQYDIPMPYNTFLYDAIKLQEEKYLKVI